MIAALLLDLDGTLLEEDYVEASVRAACAALSQRTGIPTGMLVAANNAVWSRLWDEVGDQWMRGGLSGRDVGLEAWRRTLREFGPVEDSLVDLAVEEHERAERRGYRIYDDVSALLQHADDTGLGLALVTNGSSDIQRAKITITEIAARFGGIAISGEVGAVKPEPAIFEYALSTLGVDAASAVMVGDSLENDIAGANAAGVRSVWINRTGAPTPTGAHPDFTIASLAELPALLAAASAAVPNS